MDIILKQLVVGGIIIKVTNSKNKAFTSISTKLSLTIIGIISIVVIMILIANSLFLGNFYVSKNRTIFYNEYEDIRANYSEPNEEILSLLREKGNTTGFLFYIAEIVDNRVAPVILTSAPNFIPEAFGRFGNINRPNIELPIPQNTFILENMETIQQGETLFARVYRNENEKKQFDLIFASKLDSQYMLIIARPIEQLDEQTSITNQFLLIIGLISILVSIVIAQLAAQTVVKPLKKITTIGEHIANLDFSHRYEGHSHDEIETLGNSINKISSQLDSAISQLEETNNKLKVEMNLQKRFFAGVSHEFKTPIGLIRGYTESLKLGLASNPAEVSEFCDIILDETDRLNHFVSDILFLVKSESTEFVMNMQNINIIPLIEVALDKNFPIIEEKKIELIKELPKSIMINGDELRLSQIIENILSNSLRHTPLNGRIMIKTSFINDGIKFSFKNEGDCIPQQHLVNLFEPFYSAFDSRGRSNIGTGLGLSIVKNLVGKHKGICGIENVDDQDFKGVLAWFWLPLIK